MLIRFVVSNFLSFKEETEFNMLTSKGKSYQKHKEHVQTSNSGVDVLKMASIYGANASGKSNLIEALEYLKDIVINNDENEILLPLSKKFRHDDESKSKPTSFRIEFISNNTHYDYGIEIFKDRIIEEWLYAVDNIKDQSESELFKRINNEVNFGDSFKNEDISYVELFLKKELKKNQPVLSLTFNRIENNNILDYAYIFIHNLAIVTPHSYDSHYQTELASKNRPISFTQSILKNSQTGIEKLITQEIHADNFFSYEEEDFKQKVIDELNSVLELEEEETKLTFVVFKKGKKLYSLKKEDEKYFVLFLKTKHFASENLFEFFEESDGTNRLFELIPAFDSLINEKNRTFVIDELERSMHPILAKELVKMFSETKTSSNQLIFTTHESQLLDLDLFRQDEIWFTEKRKDGSTEFYPLSKFKPREDKNIRRGYLEGRYGGIPFLGDFSKIIEE